MIRIKATDEEGRYLEPFVSYLVMNMDQSTDALKSWGAVYIEGQFLERPTSCAYLQFDDPEMATAFSLRWSGSAQIAIDENGARE